MKDMYTDTSTIIIYFKKINNVRGRKEQTDMPQICVSYKLCLSHMKSIFKRGVILFHSWIHFYNILCSTKKNSRVKNGIYSGLLKIQPLQLQFFQ